MGCGGRIEIFSCGEQICEDKMRAKSINKSSNSVEINVLLWEIGGWSLTDIKYTIQLTTGTGSNLELSEPEKYQPPFYKWNDDTKG